MCSSVSIVTLSDRTFTNVDDAVLERLIRSAQTRVIFVAPGLRGPVAQALADLLQQNPPIDVNIILDVDGEVCRLGYGDLQGLDLIMEATQHAGVGVLHQPGIRIGLLIVDENTVVYSPTPLLIEAGSKQPNKPNAIFLKNAVPAAVQAACGSDEENDATRELGLDFMRPEDVKKVAEDLKANPPKEFDIARIERVFNSALHFVEFEISDYRLHAKTVKLETALFGLGDQYLRETIENTFKPFKDAEFLNLRIPNLDESGEAIADETKLFGPDVIDSERRQIKKEFLFDIPKFGVVIRRKDKDVFQKRVKRLEKQIKLYVEEINKVIEGQLKKAQEKLSKSLVSVLTKNPPREWQKFMDDGKLSEKETRRLLGDALAAAFKKAVPNFSPTIRWIYKDVTYETIHKPDFRAALEKHFGKDRADKLFSEFDVAPEQRGEET
jgi:hypothetical protein